jgi:aspartate kinase
VEVGLCKVSAVGTGMRAHAGVAATMFEALAHADINIANITTSEIKISCLVPKEHGEDALRVVHDAFGLDAAAPGLVVECKPEVKPDRRVEDPGPAASGVM